MDSVQSSIRAAVSESEQRTAKLINDGFTGLSEKLDHRFMLVSRVEDRWREDDKRFLAHERDIAELQSAQTKHALALQTVATKDDVRAAVKAETVGFATKADVEKIVGAMRHLRLTTWQQIAFILVGLLGFLTTTGLIHPLALFTGGK
jgi:hypothetical protein